MGLGLKELLVTAVIIVLILGVFRYIRSATAWGSALNRRFGERRRRAGAAPSDEKVIDMVRDGDTFVPAQRERRDRSERRN
jgi:hypothetical protein